MRIAIVVIAVVVALMNHHRGQRIPTDPVQRSQPLLLHGSQRGGGVKCRRGKAQSCADADACERPDDDAEAMVHGHGDADAVGGRQPLPTCAELAVVHEGTVREGDGLGQPGGAGCELDVDDLVLVRGR